MIAINKPVIKLEPLKFLYPLVSTPPAFNEIVQSYNSIRICKEEPSSPSSPLLDVCSESYPVKQERCSPPRPIINIGPIITTASSPPLRTTLVSPPPVVRIRAPTSSPLSSTASHCTPPSSPPSPCSPTDPQLVPSTIRIKQYPEPIFHYLPNTSTSWQTIASLNYVSADAKPTVPPKPEDSLITLLLQHHKAAQSSSQTPIQPAFHTNGKPVIHVSLQNHYDKSITSPTSADNPKPPVLVRDLSPGSSPPPIDHHQIQPSQPSWQTGLNSLATTTHCSKPKEEKKKFTYRHSSSTNGRWAPTPRQVDYLKALFKEHNFCRTQDARIHDFCESQNIPISRIKTWYQNERARKKREEKMREQILAAAKSGSSDL